MRALILSLLLASPALAGELALVGGAVHTVSGAVLGTGTVLVKDGKITAVGPALAIPAGARVIDCAGKIVTPGLIESSAEIGLMEISLEASTVDHTAALVDPVRAAVRADDALDLRSTLVAVARRHGVTSAVSMPRGGLVTGRGAWIDLVDGKSPTWREAVLGPVAMGVNLGESGGRAIGGSRAAAMMRLREVLDDARLYQRDLRAYERNALRSLATSRLDLEALGEVIAKKMPFALHVHRASDILAALRFATEQKVDVVLVGASEGWLVADAIAAAKVPVILNPHDNVPWSFESKNSRSDTAALLAKAGVPVIIASENSYNAANLRFIAGNAVRAGLPPELALRALTLGPAEAFGLGAKYGSIERGKVANLVVWTGDPFEASSFAETVVIRGEVQDTESRQTRLAARYKARLGL